jgi:hypothetical protein
MTKRREFPVSTRVETDGAAAKIVKARRGRRD